MDVFGGLRRLLGLQDAQSRLEPSKPVVPTDRTVDVLWGLPFGTADKPFSQSHYTAPVAMPNAGSNLPQPYSREGVGYAAPLRPDQPTNAGASQSFVPIQPTYRNKKTINNVVGRI